MNTEVTQMSIYIILAIVVIVILLIVGRSLVMWWLGTGEIVANQKETIRLLKVIAGEKSSDTTTSESKMPSHFR